MKKNKKSSKACGSREPSQAHEELRKINRALQAITECNQALLRARDEISLLKEVCRIVVEVGGYKFAWVGFAEHDENKSVRPITFLGYEEEYLKTANITWADAPRGRGPTGIAIRNGRISVCRNTKTDPDYEPWRSEAVKRGYASTIALPLTSEGKTFGALNIYATKPEAFNDEEIKLLERLAGDLSYGITTLRDRAERKLAEESLKKSEERFRLLYERSPLGYQSLNEDGNIIDVNQAWLDTFGYNREEVISRWFGDFLVPECVDNFKNNFPRFKASGEVHDIEYEMLRKDGSRIMVSFDGKIGYDKNGNFKQTHCIFHNITERKQAEEALRSERDKAQKYLDIAGVMIVAINADQQVTLINKKGCAILGYKEQDILSQNWFVNFIPESIRDKVKAVFIKCLTGELEPVEYFENSVLTKTGEERIMAWYNTILTDEAGNNIGTLSSGEDVTERKKLQEQLIQSEKLTAVGTLAYGIAHEFNNILAGMMVNAELGLSLNDPKQMQECFEAIAENCLRGSSITRSLLAMAGEKRGEKELVDITQSLENVLSFNRRELEKAGILTVEDSKPIPEIFCDPGEFTEVFLNMINNARDAMFPKGGTLTIKLDHIGDNIRIIFKDTGCGIPDDIKNKIFDPFVTTKGALGKSNIPGTGLGLFQVHGIIDNYHGKIEVESKVGKGTTFTIMLPVSKNLPPDSFIKKEIKPSREIRRKLNVLIIDDEEVICTILKKFLESKGHQVTASLKANEGLKHFKKEKYDVVLSDITMPEMDGIELIKQMKKQDQKVKVIVITGHIQKIKESQAKEAGADEVLIKPFRNEVLYQTIARVVSE